MRLLVLLSVIVFPGLALGQNNVFQPFQKGCIWKYHGLDSSYYGDFNTGKYSWVRASLRIEILNDSLQVSGRDVKLKIYGKFGDALDGTRFHWRLLNDTLFSGAEPEYPPSDPIDWYFFDYLGGTPGDTLLVQDAGVLFEKLDTLLVLPNETVITPIGTFDCKVTEFRGSERRDWFKLVNEWGGVIRTYRAANIGIVKKTTWYYGSNKEPLKNDFIIDSMYIPPVSSVIVPEKNFRIVKNAGNEREKWFNIAGQQLAYVKQSEIQLVSTSGRKFIPVWYSQFDNRTKN